jgi:hypothetical protein
VTVKRRKLIDRIPTLAELEKQLEEELGQKAATGTVTLDDLLSARQGQEWDDAREIERIDPVTGKKVRWSMRKGWARKVDWKVMAKANPGTPEHSRYLKFMHALWSKRRPALYTPKERKARLKVFKSELKNRMAGMAWRLVTRMENGRAYFAYELTNLLGKDWHYPTTQCIRNGMILVEGKARLPHGGGASKVQYANRYVLSPAAEAAKASGEAADKAEVLIHFSRAPRPLKTRRRAVSESN